VIGLSAPAKYYSSFIDHYLNYVSWLRASLLHASKMLLELFGYNATQSNQYHLKINGGAGVSIVYSCLGYGVMSFWIAFIVANKGPLVKKILWISGGLFCIWAINVTRISLLLITTNKHSTFPFGVNHHLWFNIIAYVLIFILIWLYDRSGKTPASLNNHKGLLKAADQ